MAGGYRSALQMERTGQAFSWAVAILFGTLLFEVIAPTKTVNLFWVREYPIVYGLVSALGLFSFLWIWAKVFFGNRKLAGGILLVAALFLLAAPYVYDLNEKWVSTELWIQRQALNGISLGLLLTGLSASAGVFDDF